MQSHLQSMQLLGGLASGDPGMLGLLTVVDSCGTSCPPLMAALAITIVFHNEGKC